MLNRVVERDISLATQVFKQMTTLSLTQWMSQTSRLQAFVMLSCLVILVESFITPSHSHMHRKIVIVDFHSGEEDMSWNSTANAMNAARGTLSSTTTSSLSSVTPADSESPSTRFEHTVTYSTLDQWFHLLGGMEEERTSGKFASSWSRQKNGGGPPTASPTTGIPETNNKPTDHWML